MTDLAFASPIGRLRPTSAKPHPLHAMNAVLLSLLSLCSTSAGGLFALRLGNRRHAAAAFTAGALLGVVCFDLLPEMADLARSAGGDLRAAMVAVVAGCLLLHGIEALERGRAPCNAGALSASAMVAHSVTDGIAIGLALQASPAAAWSVAAAVIAHDFCDGLNTVNLMRMHRHSDAQTRAMLALNAVAPVVGAASTLAVRVPPEWLLPGLGLVAGSLLHVAVSRILPQLRAASSTRASIALTALGAACIYAALHLAGS